MSKFKEKVLSEISFAMVDDAPDLQKLYDKVAAIDEHPELNDNQKIVLDILKDIQNKWPHFHPSTTIGMMVEMQNEFYEELSKDQELEVLTAFARWGLEQEEAE
ncbi:hypothetical protein BSR54_07990 [Enterococcus faecium]|uniref:hypothetical protein n=1 Tax=Enterococcus faecium TaxID=1352 RepID=UPI0009297F15|nr:hypothetical protein [Enterococcus faecium]OJT39535.1 hypothetical protein BSR54_07990 [Enterococcus faecium]PHK57494.1 hypothetical protein CR198_11780 [Enterococcus faecium]PZM51145.1 hypothetical protein DKP90_15350 [Enterococcus faecium]HCT6820707.1 hypothetical protein [Enterococcus faecium]HDL0869038.1 hypothetical protein [Enterococcus faecium]